MSLVPHPSDGDDPAAAPSVRRRIVTFVVLTYGLSAVVYILMSISDAVRGIGFVLLMWCPAAGAVLTQRIHHRPLRELGIRPSVRGLALGIALPAVWSLTIYVPVWLSGLGRFDPAALGGGAVGALGGSESDLANFAFAVGAYGSAGILFASVLALGEEIGWRGFLVPELSRRMSFSGTALLSGIIWAVWHYPAILFFDYHGEAPVWYGLFWVTVGMVAASYVLAWLRLRSDSVWPAALLHGAHNIIVQDILDPITADTGITGYVVGEFGFALPLLMVAVAVTLVRWQGRIARLNGMETRIRGRRRRWR